jgi:hypothetical protein
MDSKWNESGGKQSWSNLGYCLGICLEGLRKTMKNVSQDRRSLGCDLSVGRPMYEAGVLTPQP